MQINKYHAKKVGEHISGYLASSALKKDWENFKISQDLTKFPMHYAFVVVMGNGYYFQDHFKLTFTF